MAAYSKNARDILENFGFEEEIARLDKADLLYPVVGAFADVDLHPDQVSNLDMGYIFEELIRNFSELSNETAGAHFTPREVIRLMVDLLFSVDRSLLRKTGSIPIRSLYDPAAGTGGMLSVAEEYLRELNPKAELVAFGQELNEESYAICKSDMMIKGQNASRIHQGNSFTKDGEPNTKFDYMMSNPPYGVDWKKVQAAIRKEHKDRGMAGRFGIALPRINDGSLLFLQHMISKMKPAKEGGSRIAIVFNASPLFTGGPQSGESEIRRWLIESDWVEAIVALPEGLFYNTGIHTYVWIITNRKEAKRQGKMQLVDGRTYFRKMPKSLGSKRNEITAEQRSALTQLYLNFEDTEHSKVFVNDAFAYRRVIIEQPLRLRYAISADTLAALRGEAAFAGPSKRKRKPARASKRKTVAKKAKPADPSVVLARLTELVGTSTTDRIKFASILDTQVFQGAAAPKLEKAVWRALAIADPSAPVVLDKKGSTVASPDLRTYEDVPMNEEVTAYFAREVVPHVPDAWIGAAEARVGYEIPLTRHFFQYRPLRPVEDIDSEIRSVEDDILSQLRKVARP